MEKGNGIGHTVNVPTVNVRLTKPSRVLYDTKLNKAGANVFSAQVHIKMFLQHLTDPPRLRRLDLVNGCQL